MTAALAATPPFSRVRAALTSLPGVLLVVVLLTVLCRVETTAVPWSPYFIFYGLLALLIPLWLGSVPIRATRLSGKPLWRLTAMVAVLAISIDSGIFTIAYDSLLAHLGLAQPFYSISGATNLLIQTVSVRQQISLLAAMGIFGLFVLLWAPVAEELFYRGYVYTSLKQHLPLAAAWGISVAAFGLRHIVHYFYIWPELSVASVVWVCSMLIFGSLMTWLYERTGGLDAGAFAVNLASLLCAHVKPASRQILQSYRCSAGLRSRLAGVTVSQPK
jgi:membrane protease YdiL (CAAX protease family)